MLNLAEHGELSNKAPLSSVVLGASGFLGAALVQQLSKMGHRVVAVSRNFHRKDYDSEPLVTRMIGDIRVQSVLENACAGANVVFHAAASTHPTLNLFDPTAEIEMALLPLFTVMDAAARCGVRKIVFPSSGGTIYADQTAARSEQTAVDPRTPYAIFKLASEQLLLSSADRGGCKVDIYRVANLYGPGQPTRPGQGVLPHWIAALEARKALTLFGDGTAERDYVYINDAAYCMASSCDRLGDTAVYNLGTGTATSLNQLVALLRLICDRKFELNKVMARPTDIQSVSLNSEKLLSMLPNFRWMELKTGLEKCWERARDQSIDQT